MRDVDVDPDQHKFLINCLTNSPLRYALSHIETETTSLSIAIPLVAIPIRPRSDGIVGSRG